MAQFGKQAYTMINGENLGKDNREDIQYATPDEEKQALPTTLWVTHSLKMPRFYKWSLTVFIDP